MVPEHDNYEDTDLSSASAGMIRKVAAVLGVIAGVLFLIAFGIGLAQHNEMNLYFLGMGLLFLLFPFLMNRRVRSGTGSSGR